MEPMAILLWLLPPVLATGAAMLWVAWAGRTRPALHERSAGAQERAQQRFSDAILRDHPTAARRRTAREASTGVAVRRTGSR
jgi:hypothetical protein